MNQENIALVRVTNIIPFDGTIKPLSHTPYIKKLSTTNFGLTINRQLDGQKPKIDFSKIEEDEYLENFAKETEKFILEHLPYVSDYNSVVLFSLNGVVPDDSTRGLANNEFSDKICIIIDPLSEHLSEEITSLTPTDTSIDTKEKGYIKLSEKATIIIRKDMYEVLSKEQKEQLKSLNCKVTIFEGDIRKACKEELEKSNQFLPLNLSLSQEHGGIIPSSDKETASKEKECLECIKKIAEDRKISQLKFFDMLQYNKEETSHILPYTIKIQKYFETMFIKDFLSTINAPENMISKTEIAVQSDDQSFYDKVADKIEEYGWNNYKTFVTNWNHKLEIARDNGTLPTPQQIIDILQMKKSNSIHKK